MTAKNIALVEIFKIILGAFGWNDLDWRQIFQMAPYLMDFKFIKTTQKVAGNGTSGI